MTAPGTAQIGVAGLAVMGRNLARNLARHGHSVALYNRSVERTRSLVEQHGDEGVFLPAESLEDFVTSLATPRAIIVMVKAGKATDDVIDELVPLLEHGDIIIDCGNAHFADTRRREEDLQKQGFHFIGCGVSGGEEGALLGPSIMPGGSRESYERLGPILESIAAQVDGQAAAYTSARTPPGTSSRWSTTASSTPTCSSSRRHSTCFAAASDSLPPRSPTSSAPGTRATSSPS